MQDWHEHNRVQIVAFLDYFTRTQSNNPTEHIHTYTYKCMRTNWEWMMERWSELVRRELTGKATREEEAGAEERERRGYGCEGGGRVYRREEATARERTEVVDGFNWPHLSVFVFAPYLWRPLVLVTGRWMSQFNEFISEKVRSICLPIESQERDRLSLERERERGNTEAGRERERSGFRCLHGQGTSAVLW